MKEFGLPPSREVGKIKSAVREAILDGDISNSYAEAFDYMKKIASEFCLYCKKHFLHIIPPFFKEK